MKVLNKSLISFFIFILLSITGTTSASVTETSATLEPIIDPFDPIPFVPNFPIDETDTYTLVIDSNKSFISIDKNPYILVWDELNSNTVDPEPEKYSLSGKMTVVTEYYAESWLSWSSSGTVASSNVESSFDSVDFSSSAFFWGDGYSLWDDSTFYVCACFTWVDINAPSIDGEFEEGALELNGSGLFNYDEVTGMFQLDSSLSGEASHQITYHIEANVVSSVPVPAAFYLFFSGLSGLMITRFRRNIKT